MNHKILFLCILALTSIVVEGCKTTPQARVVRLIHKPGPDAWQFSVNELGSGTNVTGADLKRRIERLQLRHGDIVLMGSRPDYKGAEAGDWRWLASHTQSNRVAVYLFGVYAPLGAMLFSIPVYHWVAPFDDPQKLALASFYRDGTFLGNSTNGLERMHNEIIQLHPSRIFMLGSLYDQNRSFGPLECPFENRLSKFLKDYETVGTRVIQLDPAWGF